MYSFEALTNLFAEKFRGKRFSGTVSSLYEPAEYFLSLGGKRVRPVLCLMGNELFDEIQPDAWHVANAVELFHNFTLIHDDIMDKAVIRRGNPTVHARYGESTALLSGDVMMIMAYEYLSKVSPAYLHKLLAIFNKMAKEICEGQQLDMEFEKRSDVTLDEYIHMITLKTSVLLAASLQMGALLGGSGEGNQEHLYAFGKNLGIAFQLQDDYLDAFGEPEKFGKQPGGDILANKKTFLVIKTLEVADPAQKAALLAHFSGNKPDKVQQVLQLFRDCKIDHWAQELKNTYLDAALFHLDEAAVTTIRKEPLRDLAHFLIRRQY
jgi:geranylgeranyl diphosphate synthase type II